MRHTQAPWKVDHDAYPSSNDVLIRADNGGDERRIARVLFDPPEIGNDEAAANLALILAAPDLLTACEAALAELVDYGPVAPGDPAYPIVDQLRVAISKARGA